MRKISKKHIIGIVIIILIIFLLVLLYSFARQKVLENKKYSSIEAIPTNEAAVSIMGCRYIKEQRSEASNYQLDIYLEIGKPLYEDESSTNEIYYSQLTQLMAKVNKYTSFRLIDEKKQLIVAVICDEVSKEIQQTIINGDSNYYGHLKSYRELKGYTETPNTQFDIQSNYIKTLLENDWNKKFLNVTFSEDLEDSYKLYSVENLKVKYNGEKVFNLIFLDTYEGNILNGLTTKSTLSEVIEKLGKPSFGDVEDNVIGYKSNELYVFFTEDEISVYRGPNVENTEEFINIVNSYLKEDNLKKFVSDVTDLWTDYDSYYYDAYTVNLQYVSKGIKIKYGIDGNHGITFYKNYLGNVLNGKTFKELAKTDIEEIPKYIYFSNSDSIAEYEISRAKHHWEMLYGGDYEELDDYYKMDLN